MKRLLIVCVIYPLLINAAEAADKSPWEIQPGVTPAKLWHGQSNNLLSSDAMSLENGGKVSILFFNVDGRLWRCFDYFDIAMRHLNSACYRLKE